MGGVRLPHHFKRLYWPFSWALERGFQTVAVTYIHYTMAYGATPAISIRAVHDMQRKLDRALYESVIVHSHSDPPKAIVSAIRNHQLKSALAS
jgi:hypothetical protein